MFSHLKDWKDPTILLSIIDNCLSHSGLYRSSRVHEEKFNLMIRAESSK